MRLKLDENLDVRLASLLEGAGHDVDTVQGQGLRGVEDEVVYRICGAAAHVLVTLDLHFSNVLRFPPQGTPGLVVLRGPNQLFATMRTLVETLRNALAGESPAGRLWVVEPGRLRIHEDTEGE